VDVKAIVSDDVASVIQPQRLPGIVSAPMRRLFLRNLIAGGRTTSNALQYVQETGFTNAAAMVAENTRKPESSISYDVKNANVGTIAHIFKASKQVLDDFAMLQSQIDIKATYGLKLTEEQQMLYGDGTGINLHGIVPQAASYNPAFTPDNLTLIDELRLAILQAELAEYTVNGIVLNPVEWTRIELTKTTDGAYVFANPTGLAGPVMWGRSIVATTAMIAGDFLAGAFDIGAQYYDREDANIVIATQNEDDFVKNMITIRAEERLALTVTRPEAFVEGTFTSLTDTSGGTTP